MTKFLVLLAASNALSVILLSLPCCPAGAQALDANAGVLDSASGTTGAMVRLKPPIQVSPQQGGHAFHLHGNVSSLVQEVVGAFGITPILGDLGDQRILTFDTEAVGYTLAQELLRLATGVLILPLDAGHVFVVRDTKENRVTFVPTPLEMLYLPALSAEELADVVNIAKNVFDIKEVSVQPGSDTVLVRAAAPLLLALNEVIIGLFEGQRQIAVDVSVYETDSSQARNVGVQLPQSSTVFNVDGEVDAAIKNNQGAVNEIVSSGLAAADDKIAIAAILVEEGLVSGVLSEPFALFGGGISETGITFGTLTANLSLNSGDTRQLHHALLRVAENQTATFKAGSHYPIETSSYTGAYYSANGKISSSTTPQISYQDLGLSLKVKPRTQSNSYLHMDIDLKIQALEGQSINGLPVLTNRSLVAQTSVAEGASTVLSAVLNRTVSGTFAGLPELPGATNKSGSDSLTDVTIVITPRLSRSTHPSSSSRVMLLPLHD